MGDRKFSLPWNNQKLLKCMEVHEVAEKFGQIVISPQCQVLDFWNADSVVERGAVINLYETWKRL